jgi:predicted O-linked N-acetylglucosamine transferase (SPINDLY family)
MTSRNAPCHCGSGKKFKHCHGLLARPAGTEQAQPNAYYFQAVRLQLSGQLEAALSAYKEAIRLSGPAFSTNAADGEAALDVAAAMQLCETAAGEYPGSTQVQQDGMFECTAELNRLERSLLEWEDKAPDAFSAPPSAHAVKFSEGWYNLGCAALANFTANDRRVQLFHKALALNPANNLARMNSVFALNYSVSAQAGDIAKAHLDNGKWLEQQYRQPAHAFNNSRDRKRPLRIAYLSADFRNHAVAHFILPVLEQHNRERFEVYLYYNHERVDDSTKRAQRLASQFRSVKRLSDSALRSAIMADGIDILIDLNGLTKDNRIAVLAMRAAPVQMTWIGYPNTTGLKSVDYRIVDKVTDPPAYAEELSSEKLLYMPGAFSVYQPGADLPDVAPLPSLESGHITFGSFNSMAKLNDPVLQTWADILHGVKNSHILLKNIALGYAEPAQQIVAAFAQLGIGANRVELVGAMPDKHDHLETYHRVDISLDSFPYNGTTTTCESLIMGVPVISRAGNDHRSRVGASLLSTLGLDSHVAGGENEYIGAAIGLASDTAQLASLRAGLRGRMLSSPLMDASTFTRELESKLMQAWEKWCDQEGNA